jgi:hypothetical protein
MGPALVEQIDGFVPISMSAGTYVGTLDPSRFLIFGSEDLSFAANFSCRSCSAKQGHSA